MSVFVVSLESSLNLEIAEIMHVVGTSTAPCRIFWVVLVFLVHIIIIFIRDKNDYYIDQKYQYQLEFQAVNIELQLLRAILL